ANHYSGLRCMEPKVREWGFSEGSLETLFHTLYTPPPLTSPLTDYEFVLDVPAGFSLLDEQYADDDKGGKLNRRPRSVVVEQTTHDNQPYTRYRFAYEPDFVQPDRVQVALLPLVMDEYQGRGNLCEFYYRRLAAGNLTEVEQVLPVRVLPPLNGRMPKKVMISQYCAEPWVRAYGGKLFPRHFEAFMRQSLAIGFSHWILPPSGDAYTRKVHDRVVEGGGTVVIWGPNNYPLYGNSVRDGALSKLLQSTPELQVRFFGATGRSGAQICRSYATGPGATQFHDALEQDIGAMLRGDEAHRFVGLPKTTIFWNDWEQTPWLDHSFAPGFVPGSQLSKCFCFCDNCRSAFRQWARLADHVDLSDEAIREDHYEEWKQFRLELDARLNEIIKQVCNELGLRYMFYNCAATNGTWFTDSWERNRGRIDLVFTGWPGDGQAVGHGPHDGVGSFPVGQNALDREMTFMREKVGLKQIMGQLFASGGYVVKTPLQTWPQTALVGRDGFMNAARLKPQILRIVASFHGGVDMCTAFDRCAGQCYYIGEATRAISEFEDIFYDGTRQDDLAASDQIKYPNLLVLTRGDERLVLVFNEGAKQLSVQLENRETAPGQTAEVWGLPGRISSPAKMKVTIPPNDVALVHIE
ncbi:MAG: hypothetical protein QM473_15400, partial [Acidobacteriota bacterium]|nr:hypothetical protein [Acidobacteriota bacterium]